MKVKIFVSAVSGLFLKLIYHGAGSVVHLPLLKFSMDSLIASIESNKTIASSMQIRALMWSMITLPICKRLTLLHLTGFFPTNATIHVLTPTMIYLSFIRMNHTSHVLKCSSPYRFIWDLLGFMPLNNLNILLEIRKVFMNKFICVFE